MQKDLHDIDELFRSGLDDYEATPSAAAKEAIDAALDKKEAEEYKKRFIIWKRAALFLLLLLSGFLLYETGLLKTGSGNDTAKKSGLEADKKTRPVGQQKNIQTDNNETAFTNEQPVQNDRNPGSQNQTGIISLPDVSFLKDNESNARNKNPWVSILSSQPGKKENEHTAIDPNVQIAASETFNLIKKTNNEIVMNRFEKNFSLLLPSSVIKPVLQLTGSNHSGKKKKKNFIHSWLLNPFVSYEQVGYRLDSDNLLAATAIRYREVHEPSFSAGMLITRQFKNRWGLQSGLVYTSTQIGINPQKMYALQIPGGDIAYKFITSSGYAYIKLGIGQPPAVGDSITTSDAKHLLKHISVPLSLKYKVGKNKFTVSPTAGVEANFITNAKVEVGVDLASNREIVAVNKLNGIKTFYWSGIAGAEASYQLNKKLSVNIQPVFRFALSPITKDNVVETFPRSFGIRAGVTIKL